MPNDYIAAYPPVCATSDRGDGKMRITWPAYGLDEVLLAALTTSHFVANVSLGTPESAAILATGGTKAGGFWIDVDKAYAASTWLNTHRYSPQRQATVYYYTSFSLAAAAMLAANNHDVMLLGDFDTLGVRIGAGSVSASTVVDISCWGLRANQQNGFAGLAGSTYFYFLFGDLSATTPMSWQNLTIAGSGPTTALFRWFANAGTAGGGITFSRIIYSGGTRFFADASTVTLSVPFVFSNCVISDMCGNALPITFGSNTGAASAVSHCTILGGNIGIENASKVVTYTNNLVWGCTTCYSNKTNGVYAKCAASDATGSEAGLNNLTRDQLAFYNENDNGFFDAGYGILTSSVLWRAGADTAETTDIKGNARHATTPSIGAYEGTVYAFGVTWLAAADYHVDQSMQTFAALVAGTMPRTTVVPTGLAFTDPKTGGDLRFTIGNIGDYADDDTIVIYKNLPGEEELGRVNVADYNIEGYGQITGLVDDVEIEMYARATSDNVTFSAASSTAAGTPTHSGYDFPAAASVAEDDTTDGVPGAIALSDIMPPRGTSDKVYSAAEEAARNTDPGAAYVLRQADGGPASYKHLNVTKTPAYDFTAAEAARNNDNGTVAADLALGKSVKIRNVTTNGANDKLYSAAEEAARNTNPGAANVKTGITWKHLNINYNGALTVTVPGQPAISLTATGVAVDGDAGVTNYVYYRKDGASQGWTLLGSCSGDGEVPYGALAEGSYLFAAVSKSSDSYSLVSAAKRKYVGGSTRPFDERVWMDCAAALEGAPALAPLFVDRAECRIAEIVASRVPAQRYPYLAAEWDGEENDLDTEETDAATGRLHLYLLLRDEPGSPQNWALGRWVQLVVQTLAADLTRGGLVFKWRYRGARSPGGLVAPHRVARLVFEYEHAPEPAARVAT